MCVTREMSRGDEKGVRRNITVSCDTEYTIYIGLHVHRNISQVAQLGGLAPTRPIVMQAIL